MNKKFIFILLVKWHVANFDMPIWCQFEWHMSSSNLINLMTLIWNLPLNFDVAFCNWLDKFLPPTHSFPFYQLFSIHVTSQFSLVLFLFEFLYLKFFPLAELSRVFLWSLLKDRWVYSLSLDVLASDYHLCNLVWAGAALDILAPKARTKNICICV